MYSSVFSLEFSKFLLVFFKKLAPIGTLKEQFLNLTARIPPYVSYTCTYYFFFFTGLQVGSHAFDSL